MTNNFFFDRVGMSRTKRLKRRPEDFAYPYPLALESAGHDWINPRKKTRDRKTEWSLWSVEDPKPPTNWEDFKTGKFRETMSVDEDASFLRLLDHDPRFKWLHYNSKEAKEVLKHRKHVNQDKSDFFESTAEYFPMNFQKARILNEKGEKISSHTRLSYALPKDDFHESFFYAETEPSYFEDSKLSEDIDVAGENQADDISSKVFGPFLGWRGRSFSSKPTIGPNEPYDTSYYLSKNYQKEFTPGVKHEEDDEIEYKRNEPLFRNHHNNSLQKAYDKYISS